MVGPADLTMGCKTSGRKPHPGRGKRHISLKEALKIQTVRK